MQTYQVKDLRWPFKRPIRRSGFSPFSGLEKYGTKNAGVLLACVCAMLLVVELFSFGEIRAYRDRGLWARHTQEVRQQLAQLLVSMASLEASTLRFALTIDDSDLARSRESGTDVEQASAKLRVLTADNAGQQRGLATLDILTAGMIRFSNSIANRRQSETLEAAAVAVRDGRDQRIMTHFRAIVDEMQSEELRLLELRSAAVTATYCLTTTLLALGAAFALLITAVAAWDVRRDNAERAVTAAVLRENEDQLHAMVQGVQDYGIVMMGPTGDVLSWNMGAERMTGCSST
jgi:CHASE3 domain sensor protein